MRLATIVVLALAATTNAAMYSVPGNIRIKLDVSLGVGSTIIELPIEINDMRFDVVDDNTVGVPLWRVKTEPYHWVGGLRIDTGDNTNVVIDFDPIEFTLTDIGIWDTIETGADSYAIGVPQDIDGPREIMVSGRYQILDPAGGIVSGAMRMTTWPKSGIGFPDRLSYKDRNARNMASSIDPITLTSNRDNLLASVVLNGRRHKLVIHGMALAAAYDRTALAINLGDVNEDWEVNGLDVDPFVESVLSGGYTDNADVNSDGLVDGLDVDPFIGLVVGGGVQAVPEPDTLVLSAFAAIVILGLTRRLG